MNTVSTDRFKTIISDAIRPAYKNVNDWMSSDSYIANQLRDGIRTARDRFDEIPYASLNEREVLKAMLLKVDDVLRFYGKQPGNAGEWESSALRIVERQILKMLEGSEYSVDAV